MIRSLLLVSLLLLGMVTVNAGDAADREIPDALTVIHSRKSVRTYMDQPVSKEQIEILLRAAMAAPSGVDQRPWAFVVVTDQQTKQALAEKMTYGKMFPSAPVLIVVCGDTSKDKYDLWKYDCALAAGNLLLAAEAIGLGAVYTAVYPHAQRAKDAAEILELPEHCIPLAIVPIGYPGGEEKPKDKWNPEVIHWEYWGGKEESK